MLLKLLVRILYYLSKMLNFAVAILVCLKKPDSTVVKVNSRIGDTHSTGFLCLINPLGLRPDI